MPTSPSAVSWIGDPVSPLKRLRRQSGLSQEHIAYVLGVSDRTARAYEEPSNGRHPSLYQVAALARLYGVPIEEFVPDDLLDDAILERIAELRPEAA